MIPVVYPRAVNWFYEAQAAAIADDLSAHGLPACAVASAAAAALARCAGEIMLFVSFAECLVAAERVGADAGFLDAADKARARVLLNFDSIHSPWFDRQLAMGRGYFAAILDVGLWRQTEAAMLRGSPYRLVAEAFSTAEIGSIVPWTEGRPIPWAMLGHTTRERSTLVEAALKSLSPNGFVFMPPLRPFSSRSGLDRTGLRAVLSRCDLYLWGSHHQHPYHETQRALHAVASGAVPAKIDPLYAEAMRLPWVYPSLDALLASRARLGHAGLYEAARDFIVAQGRIGANIKAALDGLTSSSPGRPA